MKKLILDLDTGVDDALAISYALGSRKSNSSASPAPTATCSWNRAYATRSPSPTCSATRKSRCIRFAALQHHRPLRSAAHLRVHPRDNGIGDVDIPDSNRSVETESAVDFIIDAVKTYGKDLIYVPTGPMTNIEAALKKAPEIKDEIGAWCSWAAR